MSYAMAIAADSSYSEYVVCVRSESTSSEGSIHHIHLTRDHSPTLFLEYHCVASDHTITLNALYSPPGHTDTSRGGGGSHITRGTSRSCNNIIIIAGIVIYYSPELSVKKVVVVGVERPNTFPKLAVTLTV